MDAKGRIRAQNGPPRPMSLQTSAKSKSANLN